MLKLARPMFALILLAAVPLPLLADEVVLTNGQVLEGEVVEKNERTITLRTQTNTMTLPRARVAEIRTGGPGFAAMLRAREAFRLGNYTKAREEVSGALAAGIPEEDALNFLDEVNKAQRQQELARYSQLLDQARASARAGTETSALDEVRKVLDNLPADSPSRAELQNILCDFHINRAHDLRDRVRIVEAIRELQQVITIDPTRAQAFMEMADIYKVTTTTHEQAITALKTAVELGEKSMEQAEFTRAHWELAELYRQSSRWREAGYYYDATYKRDPAFRPQLRDRLLEALRAYGRDLEGPSPDVALVIAQRAVEIRRDVELLQTMARLLSRLNRHEESLEVLHEIQKAEPRRPQINFMIAQNLNATGELVAGRESLRRELEVNPEHYEANLQLGDAALQRDDYEVAEEYYLAARRIDPNDPQTSLGLGKVYRMRARNSIQERRKDEAVEYSTKAKDFVRQVLNLDEHHLEANLEMGRILIDDEKLNEARDFFSKVLKLVEESPPARRTELTRLHADALIARGEISLLTAGPGTANKDFRGALEVLPDYAQAYFSIGVAYRKKFSSSKDLQDLKVAEENLLRSRDLAPENAQYALELGILYSQHLAQVDTNNAPRYLRNAVKNWQAYIDLGGANTTTVERWISEVQ